MKNHLKEISPRPWLIALSLAGLTLLVFLPAGWLSFVNYDDPDYVTENLFVQNGLTWTDIKWAFTAFHASNWHPLTWISHQADCQFFGLNPGAQHLVNVLFHAANVTLLFAWLWRMTKNLWPSALVAALFAWHPLHVESVAWIAERKDVLSTCLALLSLSVYVKYVEAVRKGDPKAGLFLLSSLCLFALGLLAKPMLVTLPCVMLLLDFWPLQRLAGKKWTLINLRRLLGEKIPFFLLAAGACVITLFAQKAGGSVVSLAKVPLSYRLENAPIAAVSYLFKFFWPTQLSVVYMLDRVFIWQSIGAAIILVLISATAWHWRIQKPYFLFGWLWFLGTLVPVIGLVQVGSQSIADRYTYIPSIGLFIAMVFLAAEAVTRFQTSRLIAGGITAVILLVCIQLMEFQLQFWRNSETLFRHAAAIQPDNCIALGNLGVALETAGRPDEALRAYRQAEKHETAPDYQLHRNLGNLLNRQGNHAEALVEYGIAIHQQPNEPANFNAAGNEFAALGKYERALKEFSTAMQLDPDYAQPHLGAANALFKLGRDVEAVNELQAAVRLKPDDFQILTIVARYLAANENAAARDGQSALALAAKANELTNHQQPMVYDVLGMAAAEAGDFRDAQACAQRAIDLGTAAKMKDLGPFRQRLEIYKKNQPWRESFHATNAPAIPVLKTN